MKSTAWWSLLRVVAQDTLFASGPKSWNDGVKSADTVRKVPARKASAVKLLKRN